MKLLLPRLPMERPPPARAQALDSMTFSRTHHGLPALLQEVRARRVVIGNDPAHRTLGQPGMHRDLREGSRVDHGVVNHKPFLQREESAAHSHFHSDLVH